PPPRARACAQGGRCRTSDPEAPSGCLSLASAGRRQPAAVPYAIAAGAFALYAALAVVRHQRLETGFDLGLFEQAVRAYARLQPPVVPLKGPGVLALGDHFHPIVAALAPLYRLLPGPVTLLIAQSALLALSVVPVTRLAERRLGRAAGA